MTLLDQIKADREAGTPGPWVVDHTRGDTRLYMNGTSEMCNMAYEQWTPSNMTDWGRIARVPDIEAALLAAGELVDTVSDLDDRQFTVPLARAYTAFRSAIEVK